MLTMKHRNFLLHGLARDGWRVTHVSLNMIATKMFILLSVYLVTKIQCHVNNNSVNLTTLDAANSTGNIINDDVNETTETQRTTCKITTERLVANAQATFTRVLSSPCNAKTIDEERFEKFEKSINKQLEEIKESITRAITKNLDATEISKTGGTSGNNNNPPDTISAENFETIDDNSPIRRYRAERFNNSIHDISTSDGKRKVYVYYWRITNIHEKLLQWETGRSERSSTFTVGKFGYAMYLKFTPKYFPDGTIFVSVGLTKGVDDAHLVWPFPLHIRIKILDMANNNNEPRDRTSRLWDPATICSARFWGRPGVFGGSDNPECVGLSLPRQSLSAGVEASSAARFGHYSTATISTFDGIYVWDDSLIVELTVYL